MNGTFELRPKRLHAIRMNDAPDKLLGSVVHGVMGEAERGQLVVASKLISEHHCAGFNFGDDVWDERDGLAVWNGDGVNLAAAFKDTGHRRLASRSAPAFAGPLAADVGFVRFHDAFEQIAFLGHKLADLMVHAPSGLVGHADLPHEFHCGNAIPAGGDYEHGVEPCPQFRGGFVEDGSGSGRDLETAPRASELLAARDRIKAISLAALASAAVWKPAVENMKQAGRVIRELFVEIRNRIFDIHANTLTGEGGHWLSMQKI